MFLYILRFDFLNTIQLVCNNRRKHCIKHRKFCRRYCCKIIMT